MPPWSAKDEKGGKMRYIGRLVAALACLAVGSTVDILAQEETEKPDGPVVAVMDFTNSALVDHEIYEPFSVGVAGMLLAELRQNEDIELVERERLREVLEEIDLSRSEYVSAEGAVRAGRILGAQYIVFGVFVIDRRGDLRIDARVVETETSRLELVETVVDDADNLLRAVQRLGSQLSSTLDLPTEASQPLDLEQADPGQLIANLKFARAILEEDRRNSEGAVLLYQEFLKETPPGYALAQRREAEERIRILTGGGRH
jgi:TolB-like protein